MDIPQVPMPEADPTKKRRRPAFSCIECRTRKVKCDRASPCSQCVKVKITFCTYAPHPRSQPADSANTGFTAVGDVPDFATASTATSTQASASSAFTSPSAAHTPGSSAFESVSQRFGASETQRDARSDRPELDSLRNESMSASDLRRPKRPFPVRGTHHKTRFFGQSHWMNGSELFPILLRILQKEEDLKGSGLNSAIDNCKTLARAIKAQRIPPFVFPQIGQHLPQRQIADRLVNCYLRTFETVYRVVHIPTFRSEYERYWDDPSAAKPAFIALMQLCMAIGACFFDDRFTMRSSAIQWIYEAQSWLNTPPEKTKMTSLGLQVMCLVRFARQVAGLGADLTWISAGSLIRTAMYMGLHRDPKHLRIPNRTLYSSELRRRLWATILEIILQSSVDAGGPPLISLADFDTEPPGNFDDADLLDGDTRSVRVKRPDEFSQTSVQIALLNSFRTRLAIAKSVNDLQSTAAYEATLALDAELGTSCRDLRKQLLAWPKDEHGVSGVSDFQRRFTEWALYRYYFALHVPQLRQSLTDPVYYFSRKMCVDTALKLCQIASLLPTQPPSKNGDFDSLLISASGPYRAIVFQGITIVGLELLTRKQEEHGGSGLSTTLGASEMRSVLEAAADWTLRQIHSGETNCKGHMCIHMILAHIDGIEAGLGDKELDESIEAQALMALQHCHNLMLESAGLTPGDTQVQSLDPLAGFEPFEDDPMDFLTGWEEVVSR
ncbi:fungal-specific transcription factor [Coniochaeta sp. 2T2.1]|nr:fungal-specific transcription factor [Coniochaeta sp. 2T2.1]